MWFRRDLRLRDHPALREAASAGPVLGLFVIDPACGGPPGRRDGPGWPPACARSTSRSDGRLCVRLGEARRRSCPRLAQRGGCRPGARHQRLHALRTGARPGRRRGAAGGRPGGGDRDAVRRGAGHGRSTARASPTRCSRPFSKAWRSARLGRPACPRRAASTGSTPRTTSASRRCSTRRCDEAPDRDADARRGRRAASVAQLPRRATSTTTTDCATTPAPTARPGSRRYLKFGVLHPRQLLADTAGKRGAGRDAPSRPSWRGATSTPTCCTTNPSSAWEDLNRVAGPDATTSRRTRSRPGRAAAPASRSSMPACASCSARAGCTTGCG